MNKPKEDMTLEELTRYHNIRTERANAVLWAIQKLTPEQFAVVESVVEMMRAGESIPDSLNVPLKDWQRKQRD